MENRNGRTSKGSVRGGEGHSRRLCPPAPALLDQLAHTEGQYCYSSGRAALSRRCVNADFLPLLLEFHGCDISFLEEIDIRIGKQTQMLQSFSEMLHQHHRLAVSPVGEEGMFEHVLLK